MEKLILVGTYVWYIVYIVRELGLRGFDTRSSDFQSASNRPKPIGF